MHEIKCRSCVAEANSPWLLPEVAQIPNGFIPELRAEQRVGLRQDGYQPTANTETEHTFTGTIQQGFKPPPPLTSGLKKVGCYRKQLVVVSKLKDGIMSTGCCVSLCVHTSDLWFQSGALWSLTGHGCPYALLHLSCLDRKLEPHQCVGVEVYYLYLACSSAAICWSRTSTAWSAAEHVSHASSGLFTQRRSDG